MTMHRTISYFWRIAVLGIWTLAGCVPAELPESNGQLEPIDLALSRKSYANLLEKFPRYEGSINLAVQDVGKRLATGVQLPAKVRLEFTVLDSPGVFAHGFADGRVVISRGMLALLNSEAQLAAVLAHEIGHVLAFHPSRKLREVEKMRALEARLSARLGTKEGRETLTALGLARVRGYSREYELEADAWSERLLLRSGYSAGAMAQVLRLLKQFDEFQDRVGFEMWEIPEFGGSGVFATHPSLDIRLVQTIERQGRDAQMAAKPDPDWLRRLDGLVFGLAERHGIQRGRNYYHPEARFAFMLPKDWYAFGVRDQLVVAPRGKDGWLMIRIKKLESGETRRQALLKLAEGSSYEKVDEANNGNAMVDSMVATKARSTEQRQVRLAIADVNHNRLQFAGITYHQKNWQESDIGFRELLRSLRPLSDAEARQIKPLHIRIVDAVPAGNPLVAANIYGDPAIPRWQLLNQLFPEGRGVAGQLIKILE